MTRISRRKTPRPSPAKAMQQWERAHGTNEIAKAKSRRAQSRSGRTSVALKPNFKFERSERGKAKATKQAEKNKAKSDKKAARDAPGASIRVNKLNSSKDE